MMLFRKIKILSRDFRLAKLLKPHHISAMTLMSNSYFLRAAHIKHLSVALLGLPEVWNGGALEKPTAHHHAFELGLLTAVQTYST